MELNTNIGNNRKQKSLYYKLIEDTENDISRKVSFILHLYDSIKRCDFNVMVNKDSNRKSQRLLKGRYVTIKNNDKYDFYEVVDVYGNTCRLKLLPKVSYNSNRKDIVKTKQWIKDNIKNREPLEIVLEKIFKH